MNLLLMYAFPMSRENIYKSFNDASRNENITISLYTTLEYVINDGGAVVWPLATNIYVIVILPLILISNIMCTLT